MPTTDILLLAAESAEEAERNVLVPAVNELIWGTIAFAIFFVVIWKFAIPRANETLRQRTENIEGKLETAERERAEAAALLAKYQLQLSEARAEAAAIRDDARVQAEVIRQELRTEAEAEVDRRLSAAEQQIRADRDRAMTELRAEVGRLSVELAGRIVGESLEDEARRRGTVDRFLAELASQDGGRRVGDGRGTGGL